ncbi:MAG: T9SS type A sorting domain-containing protein [Candidatus Competibacteraceae bacterium]|nr:T9SS type A sorting domain-containing protein [Candidatus Competibacteraceae bacterium]
MRFLFMLVCIGLSGSSIAQSLSPFVVASAGIHQHASGVNLAYTIGEPITFTFAQAGPNPSLSQGFHQPDKTSGMWIDEETPMTIHVYPNPTLHHVWVEWTDHSDVELCLFDMQGRHIWKGTTSGVNYMLDLSGLSSGFYQLQLTIYGKATKHVFTLLKN